MVCDTSLYCQRIGLFHNLCSIYKEKASSSSIPDSVVRDVVLFVTLYLMFSLVVINHVTSSRVIFHGNIIVPQTLCSDLPSGLKITNWNICSLAPTKTNTKLNEIKAMIHRDVTETHILSITESWLNNTFMDSQLMIEGYNLEKSDRETKSLPIDKSCGSGIVIYIKNNLPYKRRRDFETGEIESMWLQLCPLNSSLHLLCTAYRNPDYSVNSWISNFESQLTI